MKKPSLTMMICVFAVCLWMVPNAWSGEQLADRDEAAASDTRERFSNSSSEDSPCPDVLKAEEEPVDFSREGYPPVQLDREDELLDNGLAFSADDTLPDEFRDESFERYVDLRLIGDAFAERDVSLLTDVALQLAQAERILSRSHKSGLTATKLMSKAAAMAARDQDEETLERLVKAAEAADGEELVAEIQAIRQLADEARAAHPALTVSPLTTGLETFINIKNWLDAIEEATLLNDEEALKLLEEDIGQDDRLSDAHREVIATRIQDAIQGAGDRGAEDELFTQLAGASRRVAGYETNKFDLRRRVESGGWTVAWADDISETDVASGVVAAGVSIYSANPATFTTWLNNLIRRTINSLVQSGRGRFPDAIRGQVERLAGDAIRAAVRGQSAREVTRQYDTVDFKAGAIRYSGRNYVSIPRVCTKCSGIGRYLSFPNWRRCDRCNGSGNTGGRKQTISRTWGLKPYVAFRWRGSSSSDTSTSSGRTQAIYGRNNAPFPIWVGGRYKRGGQWQNGGFWKVEPGRRILLFRTDNRYIYLYANGPNRQVKWAGSDTYTNIRGDRYGLRKVDVGTGWGDFTYNFNYTGGR